jgi:hypothetical protein
MVEYLNWGRSNLDYLRSAGSIQEGKYAGQYNKDSMTKVLPKASQINVAVSSKVRDALLTDAASCMASPRQRTILSPDSKLITPAAYKAEYSPSECPAQINGVIPMLFNNSKATALATNKAGWVMDVSLNFSSGPFSMMSVSEKPRMESAC